MSLSHERLIVISICVMLILVSFAPAIAAYLPSREEHFFALAVLGENQMADRYYPEQDSNIKIGEDVHWFIYLHNNMGDAQYVAIRVKLTNSTTPPPNSTSCTPTPSSVIFEVKRVLTKNETWLYPFDWKILEASRQENSVIITNLGLNDIEVLVDAEAVQGHDFRMVIELWAFDLTSQDFVFGWSTSNGLRCAWNQVWFNMTLS